MANETGRGAGHQAPVLMWVFRIAIGVLVLVVVALAFWACTLSNLGDNAYDKAQEQAADAARILATQLDFAMTDDQIAEQAGKAASAVVDIDHGQGRTVVIVKVRGIASSIPGPVSVEQCYEYTLVAGAAGEAARYHQLPACPRIKPAGQG